MISDSIRVSIPSLSLSQDDLLEEDRLMLDRSPDDELGSGDEDDSDSEMDDANETTHDGERTIYPWMKKIHVAGVGE